MSTEYVDLSAGRIRYRDSGGDGPPIVFVPALRLDGPRWRKVTPPLANDFRCTAPDRRLGAQTMPVEDGTDLTPTGLAPLVLEFVEELHRRHGTLVGNHTGGALTQIA